MESKLTLYNTLDRRKETFEPINPPHVGMYVCGPTVYGDPHLGHARPAVTFDLLFRYLRSLGYKVRYVRNVPTWDIWSTMLMTVRTRFRRRRGWSSSNRWKWRTITRSVTTGRWTS